MRTFFEACFFILVRFSRRPCRKNFSGKVLLRLGAVNYEGQFLQPITSNDDRFAVTVRERFAAHTYAGNKATLTALDIVEADPFEVEGDTLRP